LKSKYSQLYWLQRWWCVCCSNKDDGVSVVATKQCF